ncbi:putative zinc finger motif, C2HC5-type-domain-containing protein [Xylaria bambusicola]|uniref:putative zinc finger motif, C2HC5-type-domain-containing protein n=1 Tax=Xylaria bambusicola TaxID=326684 RepID=UPI0020085CC2|nr:putative zinc finger motif, C2HC5-type-domain-containing protein [Xylaria bambusicola]KAI0508910.1 putative zinc finger motif, C2HC5-type-domain-containing protein [Xylaria bambusicola]
MSTVQLSRLLPLPDDELEQVLQYASTLSKAEAVDHFRNLLGDSPEVVEFIATFNSRRQDPKPSKSSSSNTGAGTGPSSASPVEPVPKFNKGQSKKKKAPLHTPAPRRVVESGPAPGTVYNKKNLDEDYVVRRPSPVVAPTVASTTIKTVHRQSATPPPPAPKSQSGQGRLISDLPAPKSRSTPGSRSSTPAPKTKVHIAGGTAMHGASTALSDLDDAIRALEMTTNPSHTTDAALRRCNCVAARHPLLASAPNCLSCGKVICVKEGLGPCTFCGTSLLTSAEIQSMIRELRDERGREKMAIDRQAHKRAEVSKAPVPFSRPRDAARTPSEAETKALEHRDRLLGFQAQNARRTTVRDEAAEFDVSGAVAGTGGNIWATPEERARELKRQQKILREMEWNARPEYEKRRQVVSIDLVGGKVVRKMAPAERPTSPDEPGAGQDDGPALEERSANRDRGGGGAFSKNPLLGGLIKPVFDIKGKGAAQEGRKANATKWRRVQDDLDDNENLILDGGVYGQPGLSLN